MTIRMPGQVHASAQDKARRTALAGAAATALIAASPALHAAPDWQGESLQAAVRNALRAPLAQKQFAGQWDVLNARKSGPASAQKIQIDNGTNITVGPGQAAISATSPDEDVAIVNTGDLTGGIGIDVATGAVDASHVISDTTTTFSSSGGYEPLYDMAGNPIVTPPPYSNPVTAPTIRYDFASRAVTLATDPETSAVVVDNAGRIAFSGEAGIRALNPAGQSIEITNSGDIASTTDVVARAGIYAATESYLVTYTSEQTANADLVRNAYGQLVQVNSPDVFTTTATFRDMEYDGGSIDIHNTGNIDMGEVAGPPGFYDGPFASMGIATRGDGGTNVVNSGDIGVDDWSAGVFVRSTGPVTVENSGTIEFGNGGAGIATSLSDMGNAGDYRLGGDVYVLNTGDLRGGAAKEDVAPGTSVGGAGIQVVALGSNNEYTAAYAQYNLLFAEYNEILGDPNAFPLFDAPKARLYATNVVNRGSIELGDAGRGIVITPMAGESTAINEGTITAGDGNSYFANNFRNAAAGILQVNFGVNGRGPTTSINAESGVIITGNDSLGVANYNLGGDSTAINHGSITTGDGGVGGLNPYNGVVYERLFTSTGLLSFSVGPVMGTTAAALNTGEVTVGDLAIGSLVAGNGYSVLDVTRMTAVNQNEGIIETGDNATGLVTLGTNASSVNSGEVVVGDLDLSGFNPHPLYTADEFAQLGFGALTSGLQLAEVVNDGTITTGDGTVGAAAILSYRGYGYAVQVIQGEDGVIRTGDDSIGVVAEGNYSAAVVNAGTIATGDGSTGVDATAGAVVLRRGDRTATVTEGAAFVENTGIVETGDQSVGVRVRGAQYDVAFAGQVYVPASPPQIPVGYYLQISGTADTIGTAYLANAGTIRTGAGSTAVEITGRGAAERGGAQLFNTGTIQAGADGSGMALRVNVGTDINSYVVNVGEIAGDIVFGAGDDRLVNTQMVAPNGQVTETGNFVLDGTLIDFGAGTNVLDVDRGVLTLRGGASRVTGADTILNGATIDAIDGVAGSTLTLGGDVSGSFTFATDLGAGGTADRIVVEGDVADGTAMSLVLNPTEQLKGNVEYTVLAVGGTNGGDAPQIAGSSGALADSLVRAQASTNAAGDVVVAATFGMGHMAIAAASATSMAQNWWLQSVESFDKRNMHKLSGAEDTGWAVWSSAFHEEGTITPDNSLQNVDFDQKVSAIQAGAQWTGLFGGGSFSVGPQVSYGSADANPNANIASAEGSVTAYGLNANWKGDSGLYVDATWQSLSMDTDFWTPGTATSARAQSDADGDGYNLEAGYAFKLTSGLVLVPQAQYSSIDVEFDNFRSSDDAYRFTDVGGEASLFRAGVTVLKTFPTPNGYVTPLADLNYLYGADGDSELRSNGVAFANDTSGSGYRAEFGLAGRYKAWDITGRVGVTDVSASDFMLSTNVAVRYRW